jgi:hypothetical protein
VSEENMREAVKFIWYLIPDRRDQSGWLL